MQVSVQGFDPKVCKPCSHRACRQGFNRTVMLEPLSLPRESWEDLRLCGWIPAWERASCWSHQTDYVESFFCPCCRSWSDQHKLWWHTVHLHCLQWPVLLGAPSHLSTPLQEGLGTQKCNIPFLKNVYIQAHLCIESQNTLSWSGPLMTRNIKVQLLTQHHPRNSHHVAQSIIQKLHELCQVGAVTSALRSLLQCPDTLWVCMYMCACVCICECFYVHDYEFVYMCVYRDMYMRKSSPTIFPLTILFRIQNSWGKEGEGWWESKASFLIDVCETWWVQRTWHSWLPLRSYCNKCSRQTFVRTRENDQNPTASSVWFGIAYMTIPILKASYNYIGMEKL